MTVDVQRPSTLDVTVTNPNDLVYIKGDATTNGSVRFRVADGVTSIRQRINDVWNYGSLLISSGSLLLELDMVLGALAGFLRTTNPSGSVGHNVSIIPHIEHDDITGTTTKQLHVPITNIAATFVLFSTAVSQVSGTVLGQSIADTPGRALSTSVHEVDTTGATSTVTVKWFIGSDNTGTLVNDRDFQASDFLASSTVTLDYEEAFGLDDGVSYFQEFSSANEFSLKTDVGGNILITHTGHEIAELTGVTENQYYDKNLNPMLDLNNNPYYSKQFSLG